MRSAGNRRGLCWACYRVFCEKTGQDRAFEKRQLARNFYWVVSVYPGATVYEISKELNIPIGRAKSTLTRLDKLCEDDYGGLSLVEWA